MKLWADPIRPLEVLNKVSTTRPGSREADAACRRAPLFEAYPSLVTINLFWHVIIG